MELLIRYINDRLNMIDDCLKVANVEQSIKLYADRKVFQEILKVIDTIM